MLNIDANATDFRYVLNIVGIFAYTTTRLTEDGSTYKMLAMCLHFISGPLLLSRGNLCNLVVPTVRY